MKLTDATPPTWLIGMIATPLARSPVRPIADGLAVLAALSLYGCEAPPDSLSSPRSTSTTQRVAANTSAQPQPIVIEPIDAGQQEPVSTFVDARPAAMVDGKSVGWGELRATMSDVAGAQALREFIIDRKLAAALADRGIVLTDDDVSAERKLLLESLNNDADIAIRLLDELRDRQALGKSRFEALLRRNAGLRAMVRDDVKIDDDSLRTMHDIVHGSKRQARIMILPDLSSAQAAINLVNSGASFADVAVEMSTDTSAARGGLLEPISQSDPNYPEALRQTLFSLSSGAMSGPVMVGDKYAVVLLFKRVAADGVTLNDARPALERMVRISQERLLMDQMIRRISLDTAVTVFDEELNESWQRAKRGG